MINSDEINLIATGDSDDPAVFKIDLTKPLELDTTWRLGLLEIVIPNTIAFLDPKKDYIEVVTNSKKRIPRAVPKAESYSPPPFIFLPYVPPVRIGNYFPWFLEVSQKMQEREQDTYHNLFFRGTLENLQKYANALNVTVTHLESRMKHISIFIHRLQTLREEGRKHEEIWPPEEESRGIRNLFFKMSYRDEFRDLLDTYGDSLHEPWFDLIKNDNKRASGSLHLYSLYSAIFSNRLSKYAQMVNMGTGEFLIVLDQVFNTINRICFGEIQEDWSPAVENNGMIESPKRTEGRDIYIIVQTPEGEERVFIDLSTDDWVSRAKDGCKIVMESNRLEVLIDRLSKVLNYCSETDFSFDQKTMKGTFRVPDGERLTLHGRLSQIYSVPSVLEGGGVYTSTHCIDPYVDFRTLYIYSDVTQDIVLGESKHPLFQTIPLTTNSHDLVHHEIFYKPLFLPLKKQHIVKLRFLIYNEIGQKIRFRGKSTSLIKLLFKRHEYERS